MDRISDWIRKWCSSTSSVTDTDEIKFRINVKGKKLTMAEIGNLSSNTADFLPQFKAIGQSLKKRFFRKPNVAEAIEQYETLCQELQREEQRSFAAICCLEAAKCQENLKNFIPQANLLVKAGKLFLDARRTEKHFEDAFSDVNESNYLSGNLQLAISCLSQAAKIFQSQNNPGLAILLMLQVGDILYKEKDYGEALNYCKAALMLAKANFTFLDQLVVTDLVINAKVKIMEYESVLKTVNDCMVSIKNYQTEGEYPEEFVNSYLQKFEVIRVVLILILGGNSLDVIDFIWPKPCRLDPAEDDKNIESPDDCADTSIPKEQREVLYNLKSLVLAINHGTTKDINDIRNRLAPFMNETHHDLMRFLIQMQS